MSWAECENIWAHARTKCVQNQVANVQNFGAGSIPFATNRGSPCLSPSTGCNSSSRTPPG
jgi:hypothetical protein